MIGSLRPLDGIRVLTVENFLAGPFCSMWLADAGAEVVKIESPDGGDFARSTEPVKVDSEGRDRGLSFLRSNRNKKSVTLDLKRPEGKAMFIELARHADIVVENLRPGAMDRLGIGYQHLRKVNAALIYVAISGFGQRDILPSPYKDHPAFDIVGQALSGLMYRPERKDDRPVYLGFSLTDIEAGILGAYGAMLALFQRHRTGQGQMVDISLYDASLILNEISVTMFSVFKQPSKPGVHAVTAPFGTYQTNDGYIVVAVLGERIWERFCAVIGQPQLKADPRFKDGVLRQANLGELNSSIEPWMRARSKAAAVQALLAGGVPASPVQDVGELFDCPHVAARNMLMTLDDPLWGAVRVAGNPVKMSAVPEVEANSPPTLGQHTEEILKRWLNVSDADLAGLRERGIA